MKCEKYSELLKKISPSAAKLYLFYIFSDGGSSITKDLMKALSLSNVTIYRARRELKELKLITVEKKMIPGYKNKKPRIKVKLLHAPAIEKINAPRRAALKKFRFYG